MSKKIKSERIPTARQLYLSPSERDETAQEILEKNFFSSIRLRNGTYKYTYSHRLDDLNELVMGLLPQARPLRIMDVAVSSGISTLEWIEALERANVEHEMVAGDLIVNTYLISVGKHLHVLADETGYPLQFDLFGKAIPSPLGRRDRTLYFLPLRLLNTRLAAQFGETDGRMNAMKPQSAAQNSKNCQRIALLSPRLQQRASLKIVEDDILADASPAACGFHVLRAANILNKSYFDEETIRRMVINLRRRLMPSGLFIACSTDSNNVNHGTIFTLTRDGSFESVTRIGNGSEVERLILELPPEGKTERRESIEPVMISG
jgi:hypothetical protein